MTSSVEIITYTVEAVDFAVTANGIAYLATIYQHEITKVWSNGKSKVIAGSLNSSSIPNPTSGAFSRTMMDNNVLYVTTGGGVVTPINGTFVTGGAVVRIEV